MVTSPRRLVLLVFPLALLACVEDQEPAQTDDASVPATGALLPWKTGNNWTYRVTDDDGVTEKVTTIGDEEPIGGSGPHKDERAHKVVTRKGTMDQTISWQADLDGKVVRYREQSFGAKSGELTLEEHWAPFKVHIDGTEEHTRAGAMWQEAYEETKLPVNAAAATSSERDVWSVDGTNVAVTVPAGTFNAIVIKKAGGSSAKTYWYVRGIGKIKETGGQTEELVSYQVAP